jgi:hypothetical protein
VSSALHISGPACDKHRWNFSSKEARSGLSLQKALSSQFLGFREENSCPHSKQQDYGELSMVILCKEEMLICLFLSFNFDCFVHLCTYFLMFFLTIISNTIFLYTCLLLLSCFFSLFYFPTPFINELLITLALLILKLLLYPTSIKIPSFLPKGMCY